MRIVVYSKQNCMQCDFTKKWLKDHCLEFQAYDVETDPEALADVRTLGYRALPVVYISRDNHWSGFRPDRLEELICSLIDGVD